MANQEKSFAELTNASSSDRSVHIPEEHQLYTYIKGKAEDSEAKVIAMEREMVAGDYVPMRTEMKAYGKEQGRLEAYLDILNQLPVPSLDPADY